MASRYIALIPTYNPNFFLSDLVRKLCDAGFSIVVVDDGSLESSNSIFEECQSRATVLHNLQHTGKGQSVKTGLTYIQSNFSADSVIVTLDAGGQYAVEDAISLCQEAEKHSRSVILGRRHLEKGMPLANRIRSRRAARLLQARTGIALHDPLSSMRAFQFRLIPALLDVDGTGSDFDISALLQLTAAKIRIRELTVKTTNLGFYAQDKLKLVRQFLRANPPQVNNK